MGKQTEKRVGKQTKKKVGKQMNQEKRIVKKCNRVFALFSFLIYRRSVNYARKIMLDFDANITLLGLSIQ